MQLSRIYWSAREEFRGLALHFLCTIPGSLGTWVRRKSLHRHFARFDASTRIGDRLRVTNPERISIGKNCDFNHEVFITGGGGVTIGDYVGIGPGVKIWSVNHRYEDPNTPWMKQGYDKQAVVIEDDVWLGANCFVMPGTRIGHGAIISAGSVLMKSVPPFAIVAGNPGRVVGWRKHPENDGGIPATAPPTAVEGQANAHGAKHS